MTALLWLRRDLRVYDHPALNAALADGGCVVPVFCLDRRLLHGRHASPSRTQFLLECLADLDESLRERGSGLVIQTGPPERVIPDLARRLRARKVFWTADVSPYAIRRDRAVGIELTGAEIEACPHPGLFAVDDPAAISTSAGGPYTVFTPFYRRWLDCRRRETLPAPSSLPALAPELGVTKLPALADLGLEQTLTSPPRGGEQPGREAMTRFISERAGDYGLADVDLSSDRSSRLSPYLHLGCVSPRELEEELSHDAGPQAFRRQLAWRDFYAHVLTHFPDNARREFQPGFRGSLRWSRSRAQFDAWREGRTGYPLVDAAMRQLRHEGWMHNRARLMVASFLTKDLGIDWRWGERWFMRMLIDGDQANNNGNWQWIASVGVDPQPPGRRIYNPTRQQQRFDAGGGFVRQYVPELVDVPDQHLAEPWTMPEAVQRQAGCVIGTDYPAPIVDHAVARRAALARYAEARAGTGS